MEQTAVVILAAGLGKRMGSDLPKVLTDTVEKPLLNHVLDVSSELSPDRFVIVIGHKGELVREAAERWRSERAKQSGAIHFAEQVPQRGTGDAVRCALPALDAFNGAVLVLYGDVPLITLRTLNHLLEQHRSSKATVSLISFIPPNPGQYGRIIRDSAGHPTKIVERKDCSPAEAAVQECNSGIMAVDSAFLAPAVSELKNDNKQGEFYLTDIVERAVKEGQRVEAVIIEDYREVEGVNNRNDLALVNSILLQRRRAELIERGVVLADPSSVFIDRGCQIAAGAQIGPQVQIRGESRIESGVVIEGNAYLRNVTVRSGALIKSFVRAEESEIGRGAQVGPFAQLRPGTVLGPDVHIGNFVETKKAVLDEGAKANHLSYLGDCEIGARTNVGAGTITCNFDGYTKKSKTIIGSEVSIGSNTSLVAPVRLHDGCAIGAGSVIRSDVPENALAVTRGELVVKAGWAEKKRAEKKAAKK